MNEQDVAEFHAQIVQAQDCPKCGAETGRSCGRRTPHRERVRAWRRADRQALAAMREQELSERLHAALQLTGWQ